MAISNDQARRPGLIKGSVTILFKPDGSGAVCKPAG